MRNTNLDNNVRYRVDQAGELVERGLTIEGAAFVVLTHDGATYEIRRDGDGWLLWTRSLNGRWTRSAFFSLEETNEAAWSEIFRQVVASVMHGWGELSVSAHDELDDAAFAVESLKGASDDEVREAVERLRRVADDLDFDPDVVVAEATGRRPRAEAA